MDHTGARVPELPSVHPRRDVRLTQRRLTSRESRSAADRGPLDGDHRRARFRFTDCTRLTQTSNQDGDGWIVHTNRGDIECESIVNAAGYRVYQVGNFYGLESAVSSMEHQFFLTEELPELAVRGRRVPLLRDPGHDFYSRQEHHGLLVGIYEQGCKT